MLNYNRLKLRASSWICAKVLLAALILGTSLGLASEKVKGERPAIAVCYFEDLSAPPLADSAPYQKLFATLFVRCLEALDVFDVADRTRVQEAVDSLKLAAFGIVGAEKVGKILGAHYMLLGDFQSTGEDRLILNVRLLDMTDGVLVPSAAGNAVLALSEVSEFCQDAAHQVANALEFSPTKAAKTNLKGIGSQNAEALKILGAALVKRDAKDYEGALAQLDSTQQLDPNFEEVDRQRHDIEELLMLRERSQEAGEQ